MNMNNERTPHCAASALQRIPTIPVNGIPTGITMSDESMSDVRKQNPKNNSAISDGLMKKNRVNACVPMGVTETHARPGCHGRVQKEHSKGQTIQACGERVS